MACVTPKLTLIVSILVSCVDTGWLGSTALPCVSQTFGSSSNVCSCNSTYCDTVEPDIKLPVEKFAVYVTTKSGSRLKKFILSRHKLSTAGSSTIKPSKEAQITLKIDPGNKRQTIVGFGGTFTDASGINIADLPKEAQKLLIDTYFGQDGIEYSLGRIPIASNDMSTDIYSYDFTNGDTGLSKFTIAGYDHLYKLPFIDQAVLASRRNVSLFASPWSSPGWMKTNGNMVGYGTIATDMAKVYANYLGRFLQEYESFMLHGRMWGLTPQSGPARSCNATFEPAYQSMCWTPENMSDWVVRDLKPSLRAYGYDHVKLLVMDDNRDVISDWADAFRGTDARNAIDGFAVQANHDTNTSPELLSKTHAQYPEKLIIGSEFTLHREPAVDLGNWERAETLARSIFQNLENYVSGYAHYNLAVNITGGPSWIKNNPDSPVIVDSKKKVFYKQPMFYIMGHFSKFIPPGSTVVGLKSVGAVSEPAVALLRPDGSETLIIANLLEKEVTVRLVSGHYEALYKMEPSSIQTFVWWG